MNRLVLLDNEAVQALGDRAHRKHAPGVPADARLVSLKQIGEESLLFLRYEARLEDAGRGSRGDNGGSERQAVALARLLKGDDSVDVSVAVLNNEGPLRADVEPTWLTTQILGQVLATIRRDLGASTGDDPPDVTDLAPIIEVLTADLRASALADGIPDEDVDVVLELLVDRYRAWFAFLLGARRATVPPPPRRLRPSRWC